MDNTINNSKQTEKEKRDGLKKRVIPLLTIVLVIAITVALFLYREKVAELGNYAYLSAFLISLVANATIILPVPGLGILIGLGASFNPILVGLVGAVGGTIGEMTGYTAGYSGRGLAGSKKMYARAEGWMRKRGFLAVFLFALFPFLPLDVAGLAAGALRFPLWKFLLACFLGKTVLYIVVIQTGAWGWEALLRFLGC